jgi:hypothetical protein
MLYYNRSSSLSFMLYNLSLSLFDLMYATTSSSLFHLCLLLHITPRYLWSEPILMYRMLRRRVTLLDRSYIHTVPSLICVDYKHILLSP